MTFKKLEFNSIEEARQRDAEIATALGCGRNAEDVTRGWFGVHIDDQGKPCLLVPTEDEQKLQPAELLALKSWTPKVLPDEPVLELDPEPKGA